MSNSEFYNSNNSLELFGFKREFNFLKSLIDKNRLPKSLLISGEKGVGKLTLINHFLCSYLDKQNYDLKNNKVVKDIIHNQFMNNLHPSVIFLKGSDFSKVKIDNIRDLKDKILKTSLNNEKRFIILDSVDIFNVNSLNALLKIIEEPSENNFFILTNNNSKKIPETVKSRCIELKIIMKSEDKKFVAQKLLTKFGQKSFFDYDESLSPGNYLKFNYLIETININLDDPFIRNLNTLISFYQKKKDLFLIDLIFFILDYNFKKFREKDNIKSEMLISDRLFISKNIHDFFSLNLSQGALINSIQKRFNYV
tara:strand:+ start:3662 stop:4591 length:930 start_codon:yes stop_codon:yes gene_type:complete